MAALSEQHHPFLENYENRFHQLIITINNYIMNADLLLRKMLPQQSKPACLKDKQVSLEQILSLLRSTLARNIETQNELVARFEYIDNQEKVARKSIESIRNITKAKNKKHVKYQSYLPLNRIYYFTYKKTHFYFDLLDRVATARKSDRSDNSKNAFSFTVNSKFNRNKFKTAEDDVVRKMLFSNDFNRISLISEKLKRPIIQIFTRQCELSDFYNYRKWTNDEDLALRKALLVYGPKNWQQISYCFEGRNNSQCFHRWMKGINPEIKRSKWSFEEDVHLWLAFRIYADYRKWCKIANHLAKRTDIQCRERFCNILDPKLLDCEWTATEDKALLEAYDKFGARWAEIARSLGNRTDNTCWRRWKVISNDQLSKIYENSTGGKLSNEVSATGNSFASVSKMSFERRLGSKKAYKQFLATEKEDESD